MAALQLAEATGGWQVGKVVGPPGEVDQQNSGIEPEGTPARPTQVVELRTRGHYSGRHPSWRQGSRGGELPDHPESNRTQKTPLRADQAGETRGHKMGRLGFAAMRSDHHH